MKVSDLLRMLEGCDPDANVLIMSQPNWPFEYSVRGIATREDIESSDEGDEGEGGACDAEGTSKNDVFIVEGTQLRYGNRDAWSAARRP